MSTVTSVSVPSAKRSKAQSSPIPRTVRPRACDRARIQSISPNSPRSFSSLMMGTSPDPRRLTPLYSGPPAHVEHSRSRDRCQPSQPLACFDLDRRCLASLFPSCGPDVVGPPLEPGEHLVADVVTEQADQGSLLVAPAQVEEP